jgi:hypothetical protein
VRRIEVEAHDVIEECVRLAGGEAQVHGAQLEQLAAAAQPGQRQGGSARVVMAMVTWGGRWPSRNVTDSWTSGASMTW